jgi:hypothetical protein
MPFEIKGPLPPRKGNRVTYGAPQDVAARGGRSQTGVIVDEIWEDDTINSKPAQACLSANDWGAYSFFAQLIKWDATTESPDGEYSIRLGYYRRRAGTDEWRFAGQTTVSSTPAQIKSLLEKTLAKKEWFEMPESPATGEVSDVEGKPSFC